MREREGKHENRDRLANGRRIRREVARVNVPPRETAQRFLRFQNRHFCPLTRINPGNQDREKLSAGTIVMADCPLCAWKSTYIYR